MRIGIGYDVHRIEEGRELVLGGVNIPWNRGLMGHSDADVLVHAIMDALLGAAALGDIGRHFPDSDEKYKGISSMKLLEHVRELLEDRLFIVGNIDATIIAQCPKLAPYIEMMRSEIARTLRIGEGQVNIKATTEEKLGFTGREEGISAQAVVLLESMYDVTREDGCHSSACGCGCGCHDEKEDCGCTCERECEYGDQETETR